MTCGNCQNCHPEDICDGDCRCLAKSNDAISFEVSQDDDIRFYGDEENEPCKEFKAS